METETEEGEDAAADECFVYVCGAVNVPGVYKLPSGSRIYEAVLLAGGLREDAIVYNLTVAEEDKGYVIGKQGRVAKALRTIARAASAKEGKKVNIDII